MGCGKASGVLGQKRLTPFLLLEKWVNMVSYGINGVLDMSEMIKQRK
jgi:hypothetical protein